MTAPPPAEPEPFPPRMIDVGDKPVTRRTALAEAVLDAEPPVVEAVRANRCKKGPVVETAQLAGVLGAKHTPALIPLCHPIPIDSVDVEVAVREGVVVVRAAVTASWRTGVEMEALAAAAAAALTIVDLTKSLSKSTAIASLRLLEKTGGRSGDYRRAEP